MGGTAHRHCLGPLISSDHYTGLDAAVLLEQRAAARGAHPFLVWAPFDEAPRTWRYAEFAARAAQVAGALAAQGVRPGDRVLLNMENCPEFLIAWFACARLGATCVAANPASAPAEVDYFAAATGAVLRLGREDCAALSGPPLPLRAPDPAADAAILFTSGTTSRPKGVLWTHANALWGAQLGAMQLGLREEDVFQVCLPLCHVVGFSWSVLPALWAGATLVLQPRFSASRYWEASLAHRCTVASHVQFTSGVLAKQPVPPGHAFRTWGNSTWSAALEARFGVRIVGWWGMTELVAAGIVGDPWSAQHERAIGRPSAGYGIRIVRDDGTDAVDGEPAHLQVRGVPGVTLFKAYDRDPEATAAAFTPDGWFRTGDRVVRHADGTIQYSERAKDIIKVGGENVSPAEVERVLLEVPGVREAAAIGRPDPAYGEVVVACVAGSDAEALPQRVVEHCSRMLARFKVPREVLVLDALPRGNLGKVDKNTLRARIVPPVRIPAAGPSSPGAASAPASTAGPRPR